MAYTLSYLLRPVFYSSFYYPNRFELYILNIPFIRVIAIASLLIALFSINAIERRGASYMAIVENADLAQIQGMDTNRFNQKLWIISGTILCIAGSFIAVERQLSIYSYTFILSPLVLAGAFLGGAKSLKIAFTGGFCVSLLETMTVFAIQPFIPSIGEYGSLIPIAVLSAALLFKSKKDPLE